MPSLREAHQEFFYGGSVEESHLDGGEKSWLLADREGSLSNVDSAALYDVRDAPIPVGGLHQETVLN